MSNATPPVHYLPAGYAEGAESEPSARGETSQPYFEYMYESRGTYHTRGECGLWCAVLLRAVHDARGTDVIARHSRAWLTMGNPEFRLICELAGFDPERIAEALPSVLAQKSPPRKRIRNPVV
jgi:hypothetical protein